jgi:hypothetical protein
MLRTASDLNDITDTHSPRSVTIAVTRRSNGVRASLALRVGNLLAERQECAAADLVVLAVDLPRSAGARLAELLSGMKTGARLLTYRALVPLVYVSLEWAPFEVICPEAKLATSWSAAHAFHLYRKIETPRAALSQSMISVASSCGIEATAALPATEDCGKYQGEIDATLLDLEPAQGHDDDDDNDEPDGDSDADHAYGDDAFFDVQVAADADADRAPSADDAYNDRPARSFHTEK